MSTDLTARLAAELRAEIGRQRLSVIRFAERAGLSREYAARRVRGELPMSPSDVRTFATALGIPADELLGRAGAEIAMVEREEVVPASKREAVAA